MNCKNCNNELVPDAKFCNKCGKNVILEPESIPKKKIGGKSVVVRVISVIAFILAFSVSRYLVQGAFSLFGQSKAELINQTVQETKIEMKLPNHLDSITTLVDITAEPNAIRYHYILNDVDTDKISNNYLKSYLATSICENKDTKNLLNRDINMEYSYTVKDMAQSYFVSFAKADCSQ